MSRSSSAPVPEEDDEVDFMSDEFLQECTKNDVRPGLLFKSSEKRRHEQHKRENEAMKNKMTQKQMEEVNRKTGLETAIGADNKGFKMLEKMGFTPGSTLGKRPGSSGPLKEPISVDIKRGRGCLGQKTVMEEKQKKKEALADVGSFRERLQMTSVATQTKLDLERARRICQALDDESGLDEPNEPWFWPLQPKVKNEEEETLHDSDDDEEQSDHPLEIEQLGTIVSWLRTTYFYCIWCGVKFDGVNDIAESCPGRTREDH